MNLNDMLHVYAFRRSSTTFSNFLQFSPLSFLLIVACHWIEKFPCSLFYFTPKYIVKNFIQYKFTNLEPTEYLPFFFYISHPGIFFFFFNIPNSCLCFADRHHGIFCEEVPTKFLMTRLMLGAEDCSFFNF